MRVSILGSRPVRVSPLTLLFLTLVLLSLLQACLAQYYSSSGDYFSSGEDSSSGGDFSSSTPFDSSSDSPFSSTAADMSSTADFSSTADMSSTADQSSSAGQSSDSSASSAGSSGGDSSASSADSSASSAGSSGSSAGASSSHAATSAKQATSAKAATSAKPPTNPTSAKAATSARQATSAPRATSAPVRGTSSSTGGIGCATAAASTQSLSANGRQFVQSGEAFAPFFYLDTATPPQATIGFGHDCAQKQNCGGAPYNKGYLTLAESNTILDADIATATTRVHQQIIGNAQLTQNQFNVLVDMAFNFGSVPTPMKNFVNGYNGQPIPLSTFSQHVATATGSNPMRVQQETAYSKSCGTPSFAYAQGDGQTCTTGANIGLCLDTSLYSCAGGAFVSGATACKSLPASRACCAIPVPAGTSSSSVQYTVTEGTNSNGMPASFTGVKVTPATFHNGQ